MRRPDNHYDIAFGVAHAALFLVGCATVGKWIGLGLGQLFLHLMGR